MSTRSQRGRKKRKYSKRGKFENKETGKKNVLIHCVEKGCGIGKFIFPQEKFHSKRCSKHQELHEKHLRKMRMRARRAKLRKATRKGRRSTIKRAA